MNNAIEVNNEKVSTIEQAWHNFSQACIPQQADMIQRQEMRRAFYAGAVISVGLVEVAVGNGGPEGLMDELDKLVNECDKYADLVKMGVA